MPRELRFMVDTKGCLSGAFGSGMVARLVVTQDNNAYLLRTHENDRSDERLFVAEYLQQVGTDEAVLTVYPAFQFASRRKSHVTTSPVCALITDKNVTMNVRAVERTGNAPWNIALHCTEQVESGIHLALKR